MKTVVMYMRFGRKEEEEKEEIYTDTENQKEDK